MKKVFILIFSLFVFFGCKDAKKTESIQSENDKDYLEGLISRTDFMQPPYNQWFADEYQSYEVDTVLLKGIRNIDQYNFLIVMGTWCPDSRREVPRFYKIIDYLGVDPNNIKMYAVGRADFSKSGKYDLKQYKIERIPTFIFLLNGKEKGRIVEKPVISLEKDIANILQ